MTRESTVHELCRERQRAKRACAHFKRSSLEKVLSSPDPGEALSLSLSQRPLDPTGPDDPLCRLAAGATGRGRELERRFPARRRTRGAGATLSLSLSLARERTVPRMMECVSGRALSLSLCLSQASISGPRSLARRRPRTRPLGRPGESFF